MKRYASLFPVLQLKRGNYLNFVRKIPFFVFAALVCVSPCVLAQGFEPSVRNRMYMAASQGDLNAIQRLEKMGYSLEMEDENGNTPYCQAVWSQNRLATSTLLKAGAKPNPKCLKRIPYVTASRIYAAAHAEDLDQLVAWKKEGLNIDVVDPKTGDSALCEAVYNYDCDAIQTLLRAGSIQSQSCMRRIPMEVREKLQCRPLKIDWATIGYTALGIGMTGALIGVLGSGGGNGTPSCPPDQRWNGENCATCSTCWKGNVCVSKSEQNTVPYYRDETTAECWTVAPPPVDIEGDALQEAVEQIESTAKYQDGHFLPLINAAAAHARGYSGYFVKRTSPYGRLQDGDVPYGKEPKLSDKKVTVGILSSGMAIGSGGSLQDTSITTGDKGNATVQVWDWDTVNKAFYDSLSPEATKWANQEYTPTGETGTQKSGMNVATVGSVKNNLATGIKGTPIGFNYDYGPCGEDSNKTNCYGPASVQNPGHPLSGTNFAVFFDGNGNRNFLMINDLGVLTGTTTEEPTVETSSKYLAWEQLQAKIFNDVQYLDGYEYNLNDPTPHYEKNASAGTFLAGIVAAMKLDDPMTQMYGVAYNAAVLPVNKDIVMGITPEAMGTLLSNSDVILLDHATDTTILSGDRRNDALGAFSKDDETWKAKEGVDVFGASRWAAYTKIDTYANKVVVVPNGNSQNATYDVKQPSLESAVPLLMQDTAWDENDAGGFKTLPSVGETNPLYNSYITVGSVDGKRDMYGNYTWEMSAYSQPCGIAASYCLVAPGGVGGVANGILSTSNEIGLTGYGYTTDYGTSMAAASVAGSVALLMGAYPHLTSEEVVDILFKTATYITPTPTQIANYGPTYREEQQGMHSYNSIFGRGIVNLEAATRPVGGKNGLWVHRSGDSPLGPGDIVVTAAATKLTAVASLTPAVASALPATFTAFDAYDRPFQLKTSELFNIQTRRQAKSFEDFKLFMRGRDAVLVQPSESFSMLYRQETNRVREADIPMGLIQMNLKRNKMRYGLFYAQDTKQGTEAYWKRRLTNPFIQMKDAYGLEAGYEMNQKWSVETGWTMGRNGFFEEDERFDEPENRMQAFTTSVVYKPVEKLAFKVATGVMKETGSSLGMVSSGAFDIQEAKTHFVGAGVAFTPMDKVRLEAMYYYGITNTSSDGGLMNLSRMTSDSFAVTASYQPDDNTVFGLQVSSPLRVRSGSMNVTLPTGRHPTEDIFYYDTYRASMKPDAREIDMSLYYHGDVNKEVHLQSEFGVRLNPDHQADAEPDYRGMVGIKWNY